MGGASIGRCIEDIGGGEGVTIENIGAGEGAYIEDIGAGEGAYIVLWGAALGFPTMSKMSSFFVLVSSLGNDFEYLILTDFFASFLFFLSIRREDLRLLSFVRFNLGGLRGGVSSSLSLNFFLDRSTLSPFRVCPLP